MSFLRLSPQCQSKKSTNLSYPNHLPRHILEKVSLAVKHPCSVNLALKCKKDQTCQQSTTPHQLYISDDLWTWFGLSSLLQKYNIYVMQKITLWVHIHTPQGETTPQKILQEHKNHERFAVYYAACCIRYESFLWTNYVVCTRKMFHIMTDQTGSCMQTLHF